MIASGRELLLLREAATGHEIVVMRQTRTNHDHVTLAQGQGIDSFLDHVGFPTHAVVVRPEPREAAPKARD